MYLTYYRYKINTLVKYIKFLLKIIFFCFILKLFKDLMRYGYVYSLLQNMLLLLIIIYLLVISGCIVNDSTPPHLMTFTILFVK